jgi:arylsulfatase
MNDKSRQDATMNPNRRETFALMAGAVGAPISSLSVPGIVQKAQAQVPSAKPNVVFILVDNFGWGDFSCYGGTVATPRIDSIATEGMRFNNYTVEAQCTPTRSAIMTGRLPVRSGTMKVPFPGEGDYGLAPWEYTMAELFSDAGYATAAFGKWHLGAVPGRLPTDQGFDEWFGIKNSSDEAGYSSYKLFRQLGYPEPQWWEGVKGQPAKPVGVLDKRSKDLGDEQITRRTVAYIKKQAEAKNPFFAYVALLQIHPPMGVAPDFAGKSGGGLYADCVFETDYRVGQILDAIKAAGIENDTIVVFSSDNATGYLAGLDGGSNGPWRGDFFTPPLEGSYRVSALIRWPGRIAAGRQSQELFSAVDWLPTLAGLIGESQRVPTDRPVDGINAAGYLQGRSDTSGRDAVLFFGLDGKLMSVKWKNFKIIFRKSNGIDDPVTDVQLPMVFNLIGDPGERHNLWEGTMDMGWVFRPVFEQIGRFQQSVAKYPNIRTGENFKGYR